MKIDFNPNAAAHAPNARGPQAQRTPTPPAPEGSDDGVVISLSPAAKQALTAGGSEYTGNSPAHQARQYIAQSLTGASTEGADGPDLSGPFGQIVKTFAPGHNKEPETVEEPDAVPEDGGDTAGVTDPADGTGDTGTTDGGDTTVTDGSDGTGDTGTTDGGDTTVADGTGGTDGTGATDGTGVVEDSNGTDGGEPVTVVDTGVVDIGDVTDELLDQLDEGAEEIV